MDSIDKFKREETFYEILGCAETSTKEQICTEYRQKARSCHPDKKTDEEANSLYERLRNAYDVLSDVEQRKDYDKWHHAGLCISYEVWRNMRRGGHLSMHWGSPKTKLMLTEQPPTKDDKENQNDDGSSCTSEAPTTSNNDATSNNSKVSVDTDIIPEKARSNAKFEPRRSLRSKRPCFFSYGRSKFRKYQL